MGYAFTVTTSGNNITINPRQGNNITIAQTGTQVSINTNATLIQTTTLANSYKGDWTSGTSYLRGDTVKYIGNVYLAQQSVTSTTNPILDTTNWTLFSSSETTSTFNTLTALTSIVAAPAAVLSFQHPVGADASPVLLSTATTAISFPTGIETTTVHATSAIQAASAGFTGQVSAGSVSLTNGSKTILVNPNLGIEMNAGEILLTSNTGGTIELTSDQNIFNNPRNTINASNYLDIDVGNNIGFNVGGAVIFNAQYLYTPEVRAAGVVAHDGVWIGSNESSAVKVIDSAGNWVGPAITDTPPEEINGITGTSQQQLDSVDTTKYDTVKYFLKLKDGTNIHTTEIVMFYDGTDITISEYGITTNHGLLGTFTADVNGSNMRLLFTPNNVSSLNVRITKTLMAV